VPVHESGRSRGDVRGEDFLELTGPSSGLCIAGVLVADVAEYGLDGRLR
jgi:hypothetical protein